MVATYTRTHVYVQFADPYLVCDGCGEQVTRWHDDERCGCGETWWNEPCGCRRAGVDSTCPSWGPVDGCRCLAQLGHVPHAEPPARVES